MIPWPDIVLFVVIGGLLALWWLRSPLTPVAQQIALRTGPPGTPAAPTLGLSTLQPTLSLALPTETLSPTETSQVTTTLQSGQIRHKVQAGDTLVSIANLHGSTIKDIIAANGLSTDGFIRAGQELLIPVAGTPQSVPTFTPTPAGGTLLYKVQAGDTVLGIAARFHSEVEWILQANKMQATDYLHIGQQLLVPLSSVTPVPSPTVPPTPTPLATRPVVALRAPELLMPSADGEVPAGSEALLTWTSVGLLAKDQWYVLTFETKEVPQPEDGVSAAGVSARPAPGSSLQAATSTPAVKGIPPVWTKVTSWKLPPDLQVTLKSGTEVIWRVQVFTGSPDQPGKAISPPSEVRRFVWR